MKMASKEVFLTTEQRKVMKMAVLSVDNLSSSPKSISSSPSLRSLSSSLNVSNAFFDPHHVKATDYAIGKSRSGAASA